MERLVAGNIESIEILAHPERIPDLVDNGSLRPENIPDPHGDPSACIVCHRKTPSAKTLNLREGDIDNLCNNCHSAVSRHDYIHPSDVRISTVMRGRMPGAFREAITRNNNRLSCITCHDLPKQCEPGGASYRQSHTNFLRGGPYRSRSDICFYCHDRKAYQRLNPHDQLTPDGKVRVERCRICHQTIDGLEVAQSIDEVDFNYRQDLSQMCLGCHPWKPHPGGTFAFGIDNHRENNHLVVPPPEMRRFIKTRSNERDFILPMEPGTGKVFCATCHNPHQEGVIRNELAARGAGSENRLRDQELCEQCHDK